MQLGGLCAEWEILCNDVSLQAGEIGFMNFSVTLPNAKISESTFITVFKGTISGHFY